MDSPDTVKPIIGIVGGIGSGKSKVASELAALGCAVLDADAIGHELLDEAEVRGQVRRRWGDGIFGSNGPDGPVDRRALGEIVFASESELAALDEILHPLIRSRLEEGIAAALQETPAIVIDAAVLFEAGWDELCTVVVFVDAPEKLRYQRVASSRGWSGAKWRRREKSQISLDTKRGKCDYIVDNSSSVLCLRRQVSSFFSGVVPEADCSR